jgi:hypothetical protein
MKQRVIVPAHLETKKGTHAEERLPAERDLAGRLDEIAAHPDSRVQSACATLGLRGLPIRLGPTCEHDQLPPHPIEANSRRDVARRATGGPVVTKSQAHATLLAATRREDLESALAWIASDYPLTTGTRSDIVLQALATLAPDSEDGRHALQLMARRQTRSDLDSAAILFRSETIAPAGRFRAALQSVRHHSPGQSLANVNDTAVIAAQKDDPFTMTAICAVAGMSYSDLTERASGLPADPAGQWSNTAVRAAFVVIDATIQGKVPVTLPGTIPVGPIDLMPALGAAGATPGWPAVEAEFSGGVPYEVLLAQRVAGGTWLAHRNATTGLLNHKVADELCNALEARSVDYRRSTLVGGDIMPSAIQKLARSDKQVGLVALDRAGKPVAAVVFASARDSGTASKSAARLRDMTRDPAVPISLALTGLGWSARNETAALAVDFGGRLYSELGLDALADVLERMATD